MPDSPLTAIGLGLGAALVGLVAVWPLLAIFADAITAVAQVMP